MQFYIVFKPISILWNEDWLMLFVSGNKFMLIIDKWGHYFVKTQQELGVTAALKVHTISTPKLAQDSTQQIKRTDIWKDEKLIKLQCTNQPRCWIWHHWYYWVCQVIGNTTRFFVFIVTGWQFKYCLLMGWRPRWQRGIRPIITPGIQTTLSKGHVLFTCHQGKQTWWVHSKSLSFSANLWGYASGKNAKYMHLSFLTLSQNYDIAKVYLV